MATANSSNEPFDSQNEIPINLLPADKHPYWNNVPSGSTTLADPPQLEYDEHHIDLIADREIDDGLEYDTYDSGIASTTTITTATTGRGLKKGVISSDGIIDDDFESELGGQNSTDLTDADDADHELMKKIEEFKIVECRGDDKFGRKVIVCSACRLPHANKIKDSEFQSIDKFYHYLLKYILKTFDRYVDMDYVIVYFHHGLRSYNQPSYSWLMKAYRKIDRKYKKNLKAFYIVHPTKWIKFLWPVLRSLISSKFSQKVVYINRLTHLEEFVHLESIQVPVEVKEFDPTIPLDKPPSKVRPTTKFHVSLAFILNNEPGETIPLVVRQTIDYLKNNGLNEPGIFRRSALTSVIKQVQEKYNEGQPVVFEQYGDIHVPACVLKTFLRDLSEPLMTYRLYPELVGLSGTLKRPDQIDVIRDLIIEKLPVQNYNILKYIIEFLNLVANYSDTNLMTTSNLSVVFGPNLAWSEDDQMNTLANYSLINMFTEILIGRYTELFLK